MLDEADEMLDLGFREDLEFILEATPEERRTLLFSATCRKASPRWPSATSATPCASKSPAARRPCRHRISRHSRRAERNRKGRRQPAALLRGAERAGVLQHARGRAPSAAVAAGAGLFRRLLSGELSQHERNHALQALRDGRARVCVATDVAARGIDLPGLALVIHADLPHDAEVLQHRSGRTGRAGRKGVSVLIVPNSRRRRAEQLMATAGVRPIWSGPPTAEDIRGLDQQRLLQDPLLAEENSEDDLVMARALLAERSAEDIAAALVRVYRARLPSPEEVQDPGQGPEPRPLRAAPTAERRPSARSRTSGVWFKLDVGSKKNADPKWLLPMLCRRGKVTKQDIGAIRIFERETKFEVSEAVAKEFLANVSRPDGDQIRIEPDSEGAARAPDRPARRAYDPMSPSEKPLRKKFKKE